MRRRQMNWRTVAAALALAQAGAAAGDSAAVTTGLVHTLDGYLAYGIQHSPAIAAQRDAVTARQAGVRHALSPAHPMVMAGLEAGMETRFSSIGVSQMLMFPLEPALERKAARAAAQGEEARLAGTIAALEADTRRAFAALYQTGRTIGIMRESAALMKQAEGAARTAYVSGMESQAGLLRMQVELASMEDEIRGMETMAVAQRQRLAALIGLADGSGIPYPDSLPSLVLDRTDDEIVTLLRERNPSLRAMDREVAAAA